MNCWSCLFCCPAVCYTFGTIKLEKVLSEEGYVVKEGMIRDATGPFDLHHEVELRVDRESHEWRYQVTGTFVVSIPYQTSTSPTNVCLHCIASGLLPETLMDNGGDDINEAETTSCIQFRIEFV